MSKRRRNESVMEDTDENIENIEPEQSSSRNAKFFTQITNQSKSIIPTQSRNALFTDPANSSQDHFRGAIKKIELKNFMTYTDVIYKPGLGLNVLCGPNGSGKSSISSAICIGLNGTPKLSGRETKLARYIKSGEVECIIKIELYGKGKKGSNAVGRVIERTISRDLAQQNDTAVKSQFRTRSSKETSLKKTSAAEIEIIKKDLGIDMTNLCQYLPQERVSEFSSQSPQELLKNSEKAIDNKLHKQHTDLIEYGKNINGYNIEIARSAGKIEGMKEEVRGMQKDTDLAKAHGDLKKKERRLDRCKKIFEFTQTQERYVKIRDERMAVKANHSKLKKIFDKINEQVMHSSGDINKINETKLRKYEIETAKFSDTIDDKKRSLKSDLSKIKAKKTNFLKTVEEDRRKEQLITTKKNEVQQYHQNYLDTTKIMLRELEPTEDELKLSEQAGDNCERGIIITNKRLAIEESKVRPNQTEQKTIHRKLQSLGSEQSVVRNKSRTVESQINRLKTSINQRMDELRRNRDFEVAFKFKDFLDQNPDKFRGRWIGPIAAHVEISDASLGICIENFVGYRDMKSFLFEHDEDRTTANKLNEFGKKFAVEGLLTVGGRQGPLSSEKAKSLGFTGIIGDNVKVDPLIRAHWAYQMTYPYYLDKRNKDGSVPSKFTDDILMKNKCSVSYFITGAGVSCKQVEQSRFYAGSTGSINSIARSTNSDALKFLKVSNTADLQKQIAKFEEELRLNMQKDKDFDPEIEKLSSDRQVLNKLFQEISHKKQAIEQTKQQFNGFKSGLKDLKRSLENLQNRKIDLNELREEIRVLTIQYARNYNKEYSKICGKDGLLNKMSSRKLTEFNRMKDSDFDRMENEKRFEQKLVAERKFEEVNTQLTALDEQFAVEKECFGDQKADLASRFKCTVKDLQTKINEECDGWMAGLKIKTLEQIEGIRNDVLAQLRRSDQIDPAIIKEYEDRQKMIRDARAELEAFVANKKRIEAENKKGKQEWLETLEDLIYNRISEKFSGYFRGFGCSAKIEFGPCPIDAKSVTYDSRRECRHYSTEDYKNYGIMIWAQFRPDSPMKLLQSGCFSGGEQSLTTMLFLLAMQPISSSPFRLIDEINQGMDNRNERLIFKALVDISAEAKTQYFIITPKLLKNLPYSENMTLSIVHNGLMSGGGDTGASNKIRMDVGKMTQAYASQSIN